MIELLIIILAVIAVVIFTRPKNKSQPSQSTQSYDRGYWAGRRDLRHEVMKLIAGKSSVDAASIQEQIDKNQWYESSSQSNPINNNPLHSSDKRTNEHAAAALDAPSLASLAKPIDYSIGLLYLGAFLFIAAASLFVLLGGVGGVIKTAVVIGVSAAFYIIGYVLNQKTKKLVEVGSTFAAIGLMLAPLSGVAVYGYWLNQTHGTAIWFGTSIACALLFSHALFKLRSQYMGYLFVGVIISLVESGFSQFGLGSYYMAWGFMLAALISLVLNTTLKNHQISNVVDLPFRIAGMILVPLSLVWSLALLPTYGTTQFIASLYFASIYFALYGWILGSGLPRQGYWFAGQIAAITSSGVLLYDLTDSRYVLSCYLALSTILYQIVSLVKPLGRLVPRHFEGFMAIGAGLFIATVVGFATWPTWLLAVLYVGFALFWIQWAFTKSIYSAIFAQLALLSLPAILGWYVFKDRLDNSLISMIYVVIAIACSALAYSVIHKYKEVRTLLIVTYVTASIIGLLISFTAGGYSIALVSIVVALLSFVASSRHKRPEVSVVGNAFMYVALTVAFITANFSVFYLGSAWILLSIFIYGMHFIFIDKTQSLIFRYSAIAGLVGVSLIALTNDIYWYLGPISLILTAAIIFYEAILQSHHSLKEVSAAIAMIAFQWTIGQIGLTSEFLVYSHLWAFLVLSLGIVRLERGEKSLFEPYLWLSLGVVTVPFALLLLGGTALGYGWVFIAEHITITFLGVMFKKASVVWWGLLATVLAVLYELRDLQFIALGILSLFVIGVAIYLTLKHQKSLGE